MQTGSESPASTHEHFGGSSFQISSMAQPQILENVCFINVPYGMLLQSSELKQEKETLSYHIGDDSDVMELSYHGNDTITIDDEGQSQMLFDACNETATGEPLVVVNTQPEVQVR